MNEPRVSQLCHEAGHRRYQMELTRNVEALVEEQTVRFICDENKIKGLEVTFGWHIRLKKYYPLKCLKKETLFEESK